jgi:hypothetical protein
MIDITETRGGVTNDGTARALEAVDRLRTEVASLDLPSDAITRARWVVDDIQDELRRPDPDRDVMASRLWRLTEFLQGEGAVLGSDVPVFDPISEIAAFIGPLGEVLLERLR